MSNYDGRITAPLPAEARSMSTRRKARLVRAALLFATVFFVLRLLIDWWTALDAWERASLGLGVSSLVMLVWGVALCMAEHRKAAERWSR